MTDRQARVIEIIEQVTADLGLTVTQVGQGTRSVSLPGTRKLTIECVFEVQRHGLGIRAFVARKPEANHAEVYGWLLQRNLKLSRIAFAIDALGDIYLVGKVGLESVTAAEVDKILGIVADTADNAFNRILELGFAESIRKEWRWRRDRGESTANLSAFAHLDPDRGLRS